MNNKTKEELCKEIEKLKILNTSLLQKNIRFDEVLAKFNTIITIQNLAFTNRHLEVEIPLNTLLEMSQFFEDVARDYTKALEGENED